MSAARLKGFAIFTVEGFDVKIRVANLCNFTNKHIRRTKVNERTFILSRGQGTAYGLL